MIYSNIYKRLIEWIEPIIKTLSKEDGINLNVYSELMDSQQTKGIIIKRIASNPEIETYITGEKLLQFKFCKKKSYTRVLPKKNCLKRAKLSLKSDQRIKE